LPADSWLRDLLGAYARRPEPTTVAIVGNAPLPPDPARAGTVDSADLVVRMTGFGLDGPDDWPTLGRRCDVVVLHRDVVAGPHTFADYTSRLYLLVEPDRPAGALPGWWPSDLGVVPVPDRELPDLLTLDPARPAWPTTGTLVAHLLTELFPAASVLLTGMSTVDDTDERPEAALLRDWHARGRIELLS
jgi:hypothetical protein